MHNLLIDNSCDKLKMLNILKNCFSDEKFINVRIATGYWDIPAIAELYDEIKNFLERENTSLQLLLGKDPMVFASQLKNPKYKDKNYPDDFIRCDIDNLDFKNEYKNAINLLLRYCNDDENSKIKIRIFRKNENQETQFLHSKCYIFDGKENGNAYGIIGSSNFTKNGLTENAELNYLETNAILVVSLDKIGNKKSHLQWFNEKWEISEEWNKTFLEQVLKPSEFVKKIKTEKKKIEDNTNPNISPYEVYIRYLQEQIGDISGAENDLIKEYLPKHYEIFDFQLDACLQCIHIMKKNNGFFLADVVGLGKTVVATLIIKKFLSEENCRLGREKSVLIVTPPAIKNNWQDCIDDFDKNADQKIAPNIDFITSGSIGNSLYENDNILSDIYENEIVNQKFETQKNYGLIIIDESHNFRNENTIKYKNLINIIDNINFKTGKQPFVGLLSATPQNNAPKDLKNQINFFIRNNISNCFPNIENGNWINYFNEKQNEFQEIKKEKLDKKIRTEKLKTLANDIRNKILNEIVVRRTRSDIRKHYSNSNLIFPEIIGPRKLEYQMEEELKNLFEETVKAITYEESNQDNKAEYIRFARYSAISFLKDKKNKELYERKSLTVNKITKQLAGMMKIMLIKRLESSFSAFFKSLENLRDNTENMLSMLNNNAVFICPDFNVNEIFQKEKEKNNKYDFIVIAEIIRKKIISKKSKNREFKTCDFDEKYREELEADKYLIEKLIKKWRKYTFDNGDPKREVFRNNIKKLFSHTTTNANGKQENSKLLVFTESLDTLNSIKRDLEKEKYRVLAVTSQNRKDMHKKIIENFDANYNGQQRNDYDAIVSSEVLAEGVNLHRINVILNYDTPWNTTKLMQRIGRVNRIGSTADKVYVYNFFPSNQSNEVIRLIEYSHSKMQAFHTMFGEDNQIFSKEEVLSDAEFTHNFDGEDTPIAKHICNLRNFKNEFPERYSFLKQTNFKELGGEVDYLTDDNALIVLGFGNATYKDMINDKDEPISFQNMMDKLLCDKNAKFINPININDERIKNAKENCYKHNNKFQTAKQINDKKNIKALRIFNNIKEIINEDFNDKEILNSIAEACRNGNKTIITALINIENKIIGNTFKKDELKNFIINIYNTNNENFNKKTNEAFVAIAITKKIDNV